MEPVEHNPHAMTAEEYSKVRAVLERIEGLRRAMVATAAVGLFCSFITWWGVLVASLFAYAFATGGNPFFVPLLYAVGVFVPFLLVIGYLSYRVNKHVDRLSRGKYEQPRMIE